MSGEFVLVTGASSGIGQETAISLSAEYNVILGGRNRARLEETAATCNSAHKALIWEYNLADAEGIEASLRDFIENYNLKINKLVYCAGMMKMLPLKSLSVNDFRQVLEVNTVSAAMLVKFLCGRRYNQSALDNVVFISSNISGRGAKAFSAYGASKSAIDGLMRCLAIELAPSVRVNSVLPGGIKTEMTKAIFENQELVEKMVREYPLGLGTTQNIADAVKFLLSNQSAWITGQTLTVDGGRNINITG